MCIVEFHNYRKRKTWHTWDTPVLARAKCDPVPPHGDVRSPKSKKENTTRKRERETKSKKASLRGCPCVESITGTERSGRYTNRQAYQCTGTHEPRRKNKRRERSKMSPRKAHKPLPNQREKLTKHARIAPPMQLAPTSQPNPSTRPHGAQTILYNPHLDPSHPNTEEKPSQITSTWT